MIWLIAKIVYDKMTKCRVLLGMILLRENWSTQSITSPSATLSTTNSTWAGLRLKLVLHGEGQEPTMQLSCGMAPFCVLHSMLAILGWSLQGRLAVFRLASLEVFHISLHTAGKHADISINMMKPIDNAAYCSPYDKFSHGTVVKCNSIDRNFVALASGYTLVHICWTCFDTWEIKILYCSFHVFSITISQYSSNNMHNIVP